MSKKGVAIGLAVVIVGVFVIAYYTNTFEIARPVVQNAIDSSKQVVSQVQGKDVVSGSEKISSAVQNQTSQIKLKNPPYLP